MIIKESLKFAEGKVAHGGGALTSGRKRLVTGSARRTTSLGSPHPPKKILAEVSQFTLSLPFIQ